MEESGLHLEHPAAATFRQHVLAGDWVKADHDLRALHDLLTDSPHVDPQNLAVSDLFLLLLLLFLGRDFLEWGTHILFNSAWCLQEFIRFLYIACNLVQIDW